MGGESKQPTVAAFLAAYPSEVRALATAARKALAVALPGAAETVGAGKVHRHVPLRTPADLERPELKRLLAAALAAWRERAAASPPKS